MLIARMGEVERDRISEVVGKLGNALNVFNDGKTPLMVAAYNGDTNACQALIDLGADVNISSPQYKQTALMFAALGESWRTVELLYDNGAKLDPVDRHGESAIFYSARPGTGLCCSTLINLGATIDKPNWAGETPISRAIRSGNSEACHALIMAGAPLSPDMNGGINLVGLAKDSFIEAMLVASIADQAVLVADHHASRRVSGRLNL